MASLRAFAHPPPRAQPTGRHGTQIARADTPESIPRADEVNAIVIDVGSQTVKAGYAGEESPKVHFPSVSVRSVVRHTCECVVPRVVTDGGIDPDRPLTRARGPNARIAMWMQCVGAVTRESAGNGDARGDVEMSDDQDSARSHHHYMKLHDLRARAKVKAKR